MPHFFSTTPITILLSPVHLSCSISLMTIFHLACGQPTLSTADGTSPLLSPSVVSRVRLQPRDVFREILERRSRLVKGGFVIPCQCPRPLDPPLHTYLLSSPPHVYVSMCICMFTNACVRACVCVCVCVCLCLCAMVQFTHKQGKNVPQEEGQEERERSTPICCC